VDVPGTYILVDHSVFRAFNKGALGMLKVDGPQNMLVYSGKEVDANYLGKAVEAGSEAEKKVAALKAAVAREIKGNPKIADLNKEIQIQKGKQVFLQTCFVCHQPDGKGVLDQIPPLAGSDFLMNTANRERIIRGVLVGQSDEMIVNGKTYKNPRWRRSRVKRIFADESYLKRWEGDFDAGANAPTNAPVTFVSWFAAKAYAQWKNKRLPGVAEWEYAASAGPTRPDGENDAEFKRQVLEWYSAPTPAQLPPVGSGRANFWGVHDLHGLVWEWVADFNTAMVTGDARGDTGLERDLFCGSGSQGVKDTGNFPAFMRYGFRSSLKADYCVHNLGFRCAKDL
jgi:formylglycine-generating enzyme